MNMIEHITHYFTQSADDPAWIQANLKINLELIRRYPTLFDPRYHAFTPTFLSNHYGTRAAWSVCSRAFNYSQSLEHIQDLKAVGHYNEEQMFNECISELVNEICVLQDKNELLGYQTVSYIPATIVRASDPNTYKPIYGYKTRYGVMSLGSILEQ